MQQGLPTLNVGLMQPAPKTSPKRVRQHEVLTLQENQASFLCHPCAFAAGRLTRVPFLIKAALRASVNGVRFRARAARRFRAETASESVTAASSALLLQGLG